MPFLTCLSRTQVINILEAFAAAPPPLDYVLPNMVAGTVGALVSPGGAGKSMLALQLAAQIAGAPFADRWFRRHDGGVLKPAVLERQRKSKGVPRGEA